MNVLVDDTDSELDEDSEPENEEEAEEDQLYKSLITRAVKACSILWNKLTVLKERVPSALTLQVRKTVYTSGSGPRFNFFEIAVTWDFSNLGPKVPGDRVFIFPEPGTWRSQVTAYHLNTVLISRGNAGIATSRA